MTSYLNGIGERSIYHAADGSGAKRANCGDPLVTVAGRWGEYRTGLPLALQGTDRMCPTCGWLVALEQHTTAAELDYWSTHGATGPAGDLARRTAAAVLATMDLNDNGPYTTASERRLLAAVCAHWPIDLLPEGCLEEECDHADGDECTATVGSVACPTCSVRAGTDAGEYEGMFEVQVDSPCSALLAIARSVEPKEAAA